MCVCVCTYIKYVSGDICFVMTVVCFNLLYQRRTYSYYCTNIFIYIYICICIP